MQYAQQFFEGLDGPASLTFLGLLFGAFLIGLLPAGFSYAFRVRRIQKHLQQHIKAHQLTQQERNAYQGKFERSQEELADLKAKFDAQRTAFAKTQHESVQLIRERDLNENQLFELKVKMREQDQMIDTLTKKLSAANAQLVGMKAQEKMARQPFSPIDSNTQASLLALKRKVESLEHLVQQLTSDNEMLRRRLAS